MNGWWGKVLEGEKKKKWEQKYGEWEEGKAEDWVPGSHVHQASPMLRLALSIPELLGLPYEGVNDKVMLFTVHKRKHLVLMHEQVPCQLQVRSFVWRCTCIPPYICVLDTSRKGYSIL